MRKILLLHGNRQTGQLLLSRMDKLRKKLQQRHLELTAVDAPFVHPDDAAMRQWWQRVGDEYIGYQESIDYLRHDVWNNDFVGVIGFSQGARLAVLLADCHNRQEWFPDLQFVMVVAGYDAPLPDGWDDYCPRFKAAAATIPTPSLHVWGETDQLITAAQSRAVLAQFASPQIHVHEGGHHVPMRAASVGCYLDFIEAALASNSISGEVATNSITQPSNTGRQPDPESLEAQREEVEALSAIFPDELTMLSDNVPLGYRLVVPPSDTGHWPPQPVALEITYPYNYPLEVGPQIRLVHDNNVMEWSTDAQQALLAAMAEAAEQEIGMPSVLSCVQAARDFFESSLLPIPEEATAAEAEDQPSSWIDDTTTLQSAGLVVRSASPERIEECSRQGLEIATNLLSRSSHDTSLHIGKGGSWTYTIGLVGKPSAGKSTFFNAATAFARQRDDAENALGGATMAPHPFTTIDPNVGFCLVPAPAGSCPEESYAAGPLTIGSTHGRDPAQRRLLPVLLKDVAGLVPGAYQGRGRGNQFLNDLTDADVLIHVLDGSGLADPEGNVVGAEVDGTPSAGASHPLHDLAWIRQELMEWVYTNLMHKWDSVRRRGRSKLTDMFGGYGQPQAVTKNVMHAVEKYMEERLGRDRALDHLEEWDAGDVHRLVSTFLGVRFPMALAMNKADLPTSARYIRDIQAALPVDGVHVATAVSARREMDFMRSTIELAMGRPPSVVAQDAQPPRAVWQCLQSAVTLREPVLVFPVSEFVNCTPLPGLNKYATSDSSLPNIGMIACLEQAGGSIPSLWNKQLKGYVVSNTAKKPALRDVLVLKPGSTVEDVYLSLKRLGAVGGEFVRAEGAGELGQPPKPVPKHQVITRNIRIIKIMTNKRTQWQK